MQTPRASIALAAIVTTLALSLSSAIASQEAPGAAPAAGPPADGDGSRSASEGVAPTPAGDLDGLEFLIGEWLHTGSIAAESFGAQAGPFEGPLTCDWGPYRSWIVCDHWTDALADLGPYAVHVVIRADSTSGAFSGLVVNPYGSSAYLGALETPERLVFVGGRSADQRVIYERLEAGRIRFTVEASTDGGTTFVPHTLGMWERVDR